MRFIDSLNCFGLCQTAKVLNFGLHLFENAEKCSVLHDSAAFFKKIEKNTCGY
jgi:hypothetical protein